MAKVNLSSVLIVRSCVRPVARIARIGTVVAASKITDANQLTQQLDYRLVHLLSIIKQNVACLEELRHNCTA